MRNYETLDIPTALEVLGLENLFTTYALLTLIISGFGILFSLIPIEPKWVGIIFSIGFGTVGTAFFGIKTLKTMDRIDALLGKKEKPE